MKEKKLNDFGYNILYFIRRKGLTKEQFCKEIGLTERGLDRFLYYNNNPSRKTLKKITDVLEVSIDDLYYVEGVHEAVDTLLDPIRKKLEEKPFINNADNVDFGNEDLEDEIDNYFDRIYFEVEEIKDHFTLEQKMALMKLIISEKSEEDCGEE